MALSQMKIKLIDVSDSKIEKYPRHVNWANIGYKNFLMIFHSLAEKKVELWHCIVWNAVNIKDAFFLSVTEKNKNKTKQNKQTNKKNAVNKQSCCLKAIKN